METLDLLASYSFKSFIGNLGVNYDSGFTLDGHIHSLVCSCFYHLKSIAKLNSIISKTELETVSHAFVFQNCNSLFSCLNKASLDHLQTVQMLLPKHQRFLTSHRYSPGSVGIQSRIHFKILVLTYRALNGQAPAYIKELLHLYVPCRSLR